MTGRKRSGRLLPARLMSLAVAGLLLVAAAGCSGGGQMSASSVLEPDVMLVGDFDYGTYAYKDENTLRIMLVEGEPDAPEQVVHLQMHWTPRAGRTPTDRTSTNATVRYVIFTGEQAGVYSGAGFLFPQNTPGGEVFRGQLRQTSVRLVDGTDGFVDRLGLAQVRGSFSVRRDDASTLRLTRSIERQLRDRLGYPAVVEQDAPLEDDDALVLQQP